MYEKLCVLSARLCRSSKPQEINTNTILKVGIRGNAKKFVLKSPAPLLSSLLYPFFGYYYFPYVANWLIQATRIRVDRAGSAKIDLAVYEIYRLKKYKS